MDYVVIDGVKKTLDTFYNPGEVLVDIPYDVARPLLELGFIKKKEEEEPELQEVKRRGRPPLKVQ